MSKKYYCDKCECFIGELEFTNDNCAKMAKHMIFCKEITIENMRESLWTMMSKYLYENKWIFEGNIKYYRKENIK